MGVIRGGALAVVSALLFVSIFIGGILLTISWSLNYENVQPKIQSVVVDTLDREIGLESTLLNQYTSMQSSCQTTSDYIFKYEGTDIVIPCDTVSQGSEAVVNEGVSKFIEIVYFTNYDCDLWGCFSQYGVPFFLVSAKSQSYFYSLFNYMLIAMGILSILGFLLAEKKSNFFLLIAVLIAVASLPFAKFDWFIGIFGVTVQGLLSIFFNKAHSVFWGMLLFAAGLFLIGLIMKLFKVGFDVSTIFAKKDQKTSEIKKKEETPPEKKETSKKGQKKQEKKSSKVVKKIKKKK